MTTITFGEHKLRIDDVDAHLLAGLHLRVRKVGSAENPLWYVECKNNGKTTNLHRVVMGDPEGVIDHINGDGLDNRRENLRVCSHAENMQNRRMHANNKVGVKGVYFDARRQKYRATVRVFGEKKSLGSFASLSEAEAAYLAGSERFHGEFSRTKTA